MRKKVSRNSLELRLENYTYPDRFGKMLGFRITRLDRKNFRAEAALDIARQHLSPAARVHGGVISAFFDFTFGAAAFTTLGPRDFCSTVELKVNYLRPLNLGDSLRCKASVIFRGKHLCVLNGFVYCKGKKEPVAMATATFNVVRGDH